MSNGQLRPDAVGQSATQGALLLRQPGTGESFVYLFTVDARETQLAAGLRYSRLDLRLRNGQGDVLPGQKNLAALPGVRLAEKLTAVRHRNRRDYWVLVHGWRSNMFYSFLLTPTGLAAQPVLSRVGQEQAGGIAAIADTLANATGYLRASADGRWLVSVANLLGAEVFAFDNATGQVSQPRPVSLPVGRGYGAEFSPDSRLLYLTDLGPRLYQVALYDNLTVQVLNYPEGNLCALALGPDGRLYLAENGANALAVIHRPNAAGPACDLQARAVPLGSGRAYLGLPNWPSEADARFLDLRGPLSGCVGEALTFEAALRLDTVEAVAWQWQFDEAAGSVGHTAQVMHTYAQPGTYTVHVTARAADGRRFGATQRVLVQPRPALELGEAVQGLCPGQLLQLGPPLPAAGTTYRWNDGATTPLRTITVPGRYHLRLTGPGGCVADDSVTVVLAPALPSLSLGPDTVLCASAFPFEQRVPPLPAGTRWRWPDGSTTASWAVAGPGPVQLAIETPLGCTTTLRRYLDVIDCPAHLPNVITPNGDAANQHFVLQGLLAADWTLTIYNRWGREVYQHAQYDNSWAAEGLADGVYYYLLTNPQTGQRYKGWVEVTR